MYRKPLRIDCFYIVDWPFGRGNLIESTYDLKRKKMVIRQVEILALCLATDIIEFNWHLMLCPYENILLTRCILLNIK